MNMNFSVILPAYNERKNLRELVLRLKKVLSGSKYEIVCIIQGKDGTYEELSALKGFKQLRLFYYPEPLGIGIAFKIGFCKARYDHIITMDADLNHQPEEIPGFIEKMRKTGADIVVGSRYIKGGRILGMPLWKRVLSFSVNKILTAIFRFPVNDKSSGYRLFKKKVIADVVKEMKSKNFGVYPEILIIARNKCYKMVEIPIVFKVRVHGKSKMNLIKTGLGYLGLFYKYMFKKE